MDAKMSEIVERLDAQYQRALNGGSAEERNFAIALSDAWPALRDLLRSAEKGQAWIKAADRMPEIGQRIEWRDQYDRLWAWTYAEDSTRPLEIVDWRPLPPAPEGAPK